MMKLLLGGSPCTHWSIAQSRHRETRPEGQGWEDGQSDTVSFEVGREESLQEIQVETYLPGKVSEEKKQGFTLKDYERILPFAAAGMVLLAGLAIGLFIYRDSRKRAGGHR